LKKLKILVLDDEINITDKLCRFLIRKGFAALPAYNCEQAIRLINENYFDIAIIDVVLPEESGLNFVRKIKQIIPDIELIIMSGHGTMDMVIDAIHKGAVDFVKKPFSFVDIVSAIERTTKYVHLQNQLEYSKEKFSLISNEMENEINKAFIGKSHKILGILEIAKKIAADPDANVLITGENGTGKEIIASIIHYASERKDQPFFTVNSSAIPETLLESEFFGHKKGAFTDAKDNKKGYFELANGGSLFLDEIADMPLRLQAKLLRAIEEKIIKPIGGEKDVKIDVRIISATNHDIEKQVVGKKFRLDLFHRINTFVIEIPPLRERPEDIEPLLKYFIKYFSDKKKKPLPVLKKKIIKILCKYDYPGNVRELRNMVERAVILSTDQPLTLADFMLNFNNNNETQGTKDLNIAKHEIKLIRDALESTQYNQIQAASLLGISRDALIRRMKKHDIRINKKI
jgi:two-component system, NtrC family, response regulator AtoC